MHTHNIFRARGEMTLSMPNVLPAVTPERLDAIHNDFIPHPAQFPIKFRRLTALPWKTRPAPALAGDVGLSFHSAKYVPAGTRLELEIPLRGITQRFSATVIMVREEAEGFEIGLWFTTPDDAIRARIVEKICYTECYLRARGRKDN